MRGIVTTVAAVLVAVGVGVGGVALLQHQPAPGSRQFVRETVASIGAYSAVQITLDLPAQPTTDTTITARHTVAQLDITSSDRSERLSLAPASSLDMSLSIVSGGVDLFDLRSIAGSKLYVRVDLRTVAEFPGISASTRRVLSIASSVLGGRWLEFPASVLAQLRGGGGQAGSSHSSRTFDNGLLPALGSAISPTIVAVSNANTTVTTVTFVLGAGSEKRLRALAPVIRSALKAVARSLPLSVPSLSATRASLAVKLYSDTASARLEKVTVVVSLPDRRLVSTGLVTHETQTITAPSEVMILPLSVFSSLLGGKFALSG